MEGKDCRGWTLGTRCCRWYSWNVPGRRTSSLETVAGSRRKAAALFAGKAATLSVTNGVPKIWSVQNRVQNRGLAVLVDGRLLRPSRAADRGRFARRCEKMGSGLVGEVQFVHGGRGEGTTRSDVRAVPLRVRPAARGQPTRVPGSCSNVAAISRFPPRPCFRPRRAATLEGLNARTRRACGRRSRSCRRGRSRGER